MSFAVFGPMPLTPCGTARRLRRRRPARSRPGESADSTPSADFGPDARDAAQQVEDARARRASAKPKRLSVVLAHDERGVQRSPRRRRAAASAVRGRRRCTRKPTPPTSITTSCRRERRAPCRGQRRSLPSAYGLPPTGRGRSAATPRALGGGERALGRGARHPAPQRPRPPVRQAWQIASASASAASAGFGTASSPRMRATIAPTCALSARAVAGDRGLHLARRVQRDREPALGGERAARRRSPGPCP